MVMCDLPCVSYELALCLTSALAHTHTGTHSHVTAVDYPTKRSSYATTSIRSFLGAHDPSGSFQVVGRGSGF